jgi:hypothetical protein
VVRDIGGSLMLIGGNGLARLVWFVFGAVVCAFAVGG